MNKRLNAFAVWLFNRTRPAFAPKLDLAEFAALAEAREHYETLYHSTHADLITCLEVIADREERDAVKASKPAAVKSVKSKAEKPKSRRKKSL
jgi:hypothetical protein